MKRLKHNDHSNQGNGQHVVHKGPLTQGSVEERFQVLDAVISRAKLMSKLGMSYDDDRDLYEALGRDQTLTYAQFAALYERQGFAKAVIDRPVEATWKDGFEIIENDDKNTTPLEQAWIDLEDRLKLTSRFIRVDKLSSLGQYGVLFLGIDDAQSRADQQKPVDTGRENRLLYVKPLGEDGAKIDTWQQDSAHARFGMPVTYDISISSPASAESESFPVHYTRIIHITDELLESEIVGVPQLQAIYNRLKDLELLLGGSAEMFWRGARPGYQGKVNEEYQLTDDVKDDLQDQLDEYEHRLRRFLLNEGVEWEALAPQVADPSNHVKVQLQAIAAEKGFPLRMLTGSERGEMASTEDKTTWLEKIDSRRQNHARPHIIRPFVDRCVAYQIMPEPAEKYQVRFPDLWAPSEKEKVEIGKIRSETVKNITSTPGARDMIPDEILYQHLLGFDENQMTLALELQQELMREEEQVMAEGTA